MNFQNFSIWNIIKFIEFFPTRKTKIWLLKIGKFWDGVQNMSCHDVEQPGFWNFKITNMKITKHELFNFFIDEFLLKFF